MIIPRRLSKRLRAKSIDTDGGAECLEAFKEYSRKPGLSYDGLPSAHLPRRFFPRDTEKHQQILLPLRGGISTDFFRYCFLVGRERAGFGNNGLEQEGKLDQGKTRRSKQLGDRLYGPVPWS